VKRVITLLLLPARKYGIGIDVETAGEWMDFEASIIAKYGKSDSIHG
jgi:tRNA-(ms[2]io[6]A)-hydroxylase